MTGEGHQRYDCDEACGCYPEGCSAGFICEPRLVTRAARDAVLHAVSRGTLHTQPRRILLPPMQGLLVFAIKPSSLFTVSPELAEGSNHEQTALRQAHGQRVGYN